MKPTDTCLPCKECKGQLTHSLNCPKGPGHMRRRFGVPCGPGNCDTPRTQEEIEATYHYQHRGDHE